MQKKVTDFFASNPEATVVFGALGILFTDFENAEKFTGGTSAKVETYTREQFQEQGPEAPEAPEAPETQETPEATEAPETPEVKSAAEKKATAPKGGRGGKKKD